MSVAASALTALAAVCGLAAVIGLVETMDRRQDYWSVIFLFAMAGALGVAAAHA